KNALAAVRPGEVAEADGARLLHVVAVLARDRVRLIVERLQGRHVSLIDAEVRRARTQLVSREPVEVGRSVERWIHRAAASLRALLHGLKQHGVLREREAARRPHDELDGAVWRAGLELVAHDVATTLLHAAP